MLALGLGLHLGQSEIIWTPAQLFSGASGFWCGGGLGFSLV